MQIDRDKLKNPIVDLPGWAVKDACVRWHEGYFYIFASAFFEEDGMERSHLLGMRTTVLGEAPEILFCSYGKERGAYGLASPELTEKDGLFYLCYNSWGNKPGEPNRLFYAVSADLQLWDFHKPLAAETTQGVRAIDAALAFANDKVYLCWKEKQRIQFAWAADMDVPQWTRIPVQMDGWHENVQFLCIDGVWHMMATGYYGLRFRHRPFLLRMDGDPAQDESWGRWERLRMIEPPQQDFNTAELANAAYLLDARESDGLFYLLYAGTIDQALHAKRGDCRLGIAWSKDLQSWEVT